MSLRARFLLHSWLHGAARTLPVSHSIVLSCPLSWSLIHHELKTKTYRAVYSLHHIPARHQLPTVWPIRWPVVSLLFKDSLTTLAMNPQSDLVYSQQKCSRTMTGRLKFSLKLSCNKDVVLLYLPTGFPKQGMLF